MERSLRPDGPSRVALFAYHNDAYIVHNFRDQAVNIELIADPRVSEMVDTQSGERLAREEACAGGVGP